MKKNFFLFLILILIMSCINTHAADMCKPGALEEINYLQGDDTYATMTYCTKTLFKSAGCMPSSYAMIVANLSDRSVTPKEIRDYICAGGLKSVVRTAEDNGNCASCALKTNEYPAAKEMAEHFNVTFSQLSISTSDATDQKVNELKDILNSGKMIIASIVCPNPGQGNDVKGCKFTSSSSGHYIVLSNVDSNGQIVVLNPGSQATAKNAWSDQVIKDEVIAVLNQGMWEATGTATTCNTGTGSQSGGSSGGMMNDPHSNIFPNIEGTKCENGNESTIFVDCNGEYTVLKEFLDDLFLLIKIAAPVLVIVLSTIDYVKALANSNADELKKTNKRTIMRLIIGLLIFLLPFLLDLLFQLFGLYGLNTSGIGK